MKVRFVVSVLAMSWSFPSQIVAAPFDTRPRLVVTGHAMIRTEPEIATLSFAVRGEGSTSDAAVGELVKKQATITDALSGLLGTTATISTGKLSISEARDKVCDADDDDRPRLSSGPCAVRGYIAVVLASVRVSPVKDAGTALGLAARLGAINGRVEEYSLRQPDVARTRAETAAILDAKSRAGAIATAAGQRLGALISVQDQASRDMSENEIVVTGQLASPPMVAPPIPINLKPEPIETSATMTVTYAIEP